MAKKKKPKSKRTLNKPPVPNVRNLPRSPSREMSKQFQIAQAIWKASEHQEPVIKDYRRKEALGWAVIAARLEGELTAQHGGSFADCLRSIMKEIEAQIVSLTKGDGA